MALLYFVCSCAYLILVILAAAWASRDASSRGREGGVWAALVLLPHGLVLLAAHLQLHTTVISAQTYTATTALLLLWAWSPPVVWLLVRPARLPPDDALRKLNEPPAESRFTGAGRPRP